MKKSFFRRGEIVKGFEILEINFSDTIVTYNCKCLKCGKESLKTETNLRFKNNGCIHCARVNHRSNFLYQVGESVNNFLITKTWFGVTETDKHPNKRYLCSCLKCGAESIKTESTLKKGFGCKNCPKTVGRRSEYLYNVGDVIGTKKITKRWYGQKETCKKNTKNYDYECLKCGFKDTSSEGNLKKVCPACCKTPQTVVEDLNSIVANEENRWMIPYFIDGYEEAKKYTPWSSKKVIFKCPYCGRFSKKMTINELNRRKKLNCVCGDGMSYPEKFFFSLLEQFHFDFEYDTPTSWSCNKRYDFLLKIKSKNVIVETHGGQHYKDVPTWKRQDGLSESQNDAVKKELALKNGIENYFEIDCSKSEFYFIKKSITESGVLDFLDLKAEDIDWELCEKDARKNLVYEVCMFFNDNPGLNASKIAKTFNISSTTANSYLKRGTEIGWCSYNPKKILIKSASQNRAKTPDHIVKQICLYKKNNPETFTSELSEIFGLSSTAIKRALKIGNKEGLCIYNTEDERLRAKEKSKSMTSKMKSKEIILFDADDNIVTIKKSVIEMHKFITENEIMNIHRSTVAENCRLGRKRNGFYFKYTEKLSEAELKKIIKFKKTTRNE